MEENEVCVTMVLKVIYAYKDEGIGNTTEKIKIMQVNSGVLKVRDLCYTFGKILVCIFVCNINLHKFGMGFSRALCLLCVLTDVDFHWISFPRSWRS